MAGRVVDATTDDSIRIEIPGQGRSIQIPAHMVLAVDRIFRTVFLSREELCVGIVDDANTGDEGWQASIGYVVCGGIAGTPWQALASLADELEKSI